MSQHRITVYRPEDQEHTLLVTLPEGSIEWLTPRPTYDLPQWEEGERDAVELEALEAAWDDYEGCATHATTASALGAYRHD